MPSRRVFIVEDSPVIRSNLIDTLEELAPVTVVGWAERKSEAVQWLRGHEQEWDLLVIDIFLKEGSGLGVLEACKERAPERKAVVFSNYATVDLRQKCIELGADAVFDKSNEIDQLIAYCGSTESTANGSTAHS
ncbi:MAG TPA: response regulator [Methylibium sp.]|uniref:response regulator transcription factor n=1 Tax=Methylibium sp. TaxID=2067992 RepID=UPI002DC05D72|nr:response regulator [Methylibium sp.]HEU4457578.1 response regulator [Methylibium sp.]